MADPAVLAFDFGASSARLFSVKISAAKLACKELHRFNNVYKKNDTYFFWQQEFLFEQMIEGLKKASELQENFLSVGVDTWGVDYVVLDAEGKELSPPIAYRDSRTDDLMQKYFESVLPQKKVYEKTGLQFMQFNTLYQLYAETLYRSELINKSSTLLFMADYFHYRLGAQFRVEQSLASTSQLLNVHTGDWDTELTQSLTLPQQIFIEICNSGTVIGKLKKELQKKTGLGEMQIITPASHDTASAVLATPVTHVQDSWAYLSSGTWSIFGIESTQPLVNEESFEHNLTNERGYGGSYRILKNLSGLWLIQELARECKNKYSFNELATMATQAQAFKFIIDPSAKDFFAPTSMQKSIADFCTRTGQGSPQTISEFVRCAYDSLALLYQKTLTEFEFILGKKIKHIYIIGGGSQVDLLNSLCATVCDRPVTAGPAEATVIGNALAQFLGLGKIKTVAEARQLVANSFELQHYQAQAWPERTTVLEKFKKLFHEK